MFFRSEKVKHRSALRLFICFVFSPRRCHYASKTSLQVENSQTVSIVKNREGLSREQIAELYQRTGVLVLRRCLLILRDEDAAQDVLQEVFIRLIQYGAGLNHDKVPLAWLYRTAERCCFDRIKKGLHYPISDSKLVAETASFCDDQERIDSSNIVFRYFYKLEPKIQQLALLYYLDGLTQEQIASELKWSRRTVGKKLKQLQQRADKLRQLDQDG